MARKKKIITFEKKSNQFEFKIEGLEDFEVTNVTRPMFEIKSGNITLSSFNVILKDISNPSLPHTLMKWFAEQVTTENYVPRNATLKLFDTGGNVIEKWKYGRIRLMCINFNECAELTVSWSEDLYVSITCSCEEYELQSL